MSRASIENGTTWRVETAALLMCVVAACNSIAGLDDLSYVLGPDGGGTAGTGVGGGGGSGGSEGGSGGAGGPPPFCDVNDKTLIACYTFNSGFDDESGFKNVNTSADSLQDGWEGTAAYFSSGKSMVITDQPFWHVDAFTVEMWTKWDPVGVDRYWLDSPGRFIMSSANSQFYCGLSGQSYFSNGYALPSDKWMHIACVYDGAVLTQYIDGVVSKQKEFNVTIPDTSVHTKIGVDSGELYPLYGLIDNLRIFNIARSAEQICTSAGRNDC
jgi:hypothetical protein